MSEETVIRNLIEKWAKGVRERDYGPILANHTDNVVMFDVPEPFQSVGIKAYKETWDLFFDNVKEGDGSFDIEDLSIHAGNEIAFA